MKERKKVAEAAARTKEQERMDKLERMMARMMEESKKDN